MPVERAENFLQNDTKFEYVSSTKSWEMNFFRIFHLSELRTRFSKNWFSKLQILNSHTYLGEYCTWLSAIGFKMMLKHSSMACYLKLKTNFSDFVSAHHKISILFNRHNTDIDKVWRSFRYDTISIEYRYYFPISMSLMMWNYAELHRNDNIRKCVQSQTNVREYGHTFHL